MGIEGLHYPTSTTAEPLSTGGRFGIALERPPPFSGPMDNHSNTHGPDVAEEDTYMRWLDKGAVPTVRQPLAEQRCEDVSVLRSVPNRQTLGVFHAVSTRDGEARARDGESFFVLNPLAIQGDEAIVEIQFADGFWMLATPTDLEKTGLNASGQSE